MKLRIFTEPQQGADYQTLRAVALAAEELGFDAFFRSDHYLAMGGAGLPGPTDSWVALGALAVETFAKWAFDRQLDVDFGAGSEQFKAYWSRGNRSYCCTAQSVNSWWGLVALCARRWPRNVTKRVRALAGRAEAEEVDLSARPDGSPADGDFAQDKGAVN